MKKMELSKWIALAALLLTVSVTGCGAGTTTNEQAEVPREVTVDLAAALAEIDALTASADVDKAVFAELKAELTRLLGEPEETGYRDSSQAGKYFDSSDIRMNDLRLRAGSQVASPYVRAEYHFLGDYDQNGEVNAADLVPLARHLGKSDINTTFLSHVDGDANGEINVADIVPIASRYGRRMTEMKLYASEKISDYSWAKGSTSRIKELASLPFAERKLLGGENLNYFYFPDSGLTASSYFWTESGDNARPGAISYRRKGFALSREAVLQYNSATGYLDWHSYLHGDYDGNTEVNVSDFNYLGFVMDTAVDGSDEFLAGLDGNSDGHIGFADWYLVDLFFQNRVEYHNIYMTMDIEEIPSSPEELAYILPYMPGHNAHFSAVYSDDLQNPEYLDWLNGKPRTVYDRRAILPSLPSGAWVWVRPVYATTGEIGPTSNVIQIP